MRSWGWLGGVAVCVCGGGGDCRAPAQAVSASDALLDSYSPSFPLSDS